MGRNRIDYHSNFKWQGPLCLKVANYTCAHCGIKRGEDFITKEGPSKSAVIQAAHLNHDPWNPDPRLRALCGACHNQYDSEPRTKHRGQSIRHSKHQRRLAAGENEIWEKTPRPISRYQNQILYNPDGSYSFYGAEGDYYVGKIIHQDTAAYFTWLSNIDKFFFGGKNGNISVSSRGKNWEILKTIRFKGKTKNLRRYYNDVIELSCAALEECILDFNRREFEIKSQEGKTGMSDDKYTESVLVTMEGKNIKATEIVTSVVEGIHIPLEITLKCFEPSSELPNGILYPSPRVYVDRMRSNVSHGCISIKNETVEITYGDWIVYKDGFPVRIFSMDAFQMAFGDID